MSESRAGQPPRQRSDAWTTVKGCIFCGGGGTEGNKMSWEHAVPEWVRGALPHGDVPNWFTSRSANEPVRPGSVGRAATTRFKIVCTRCNNGWMSELEKQAGPLMTGLVRGESTPALSDVEQNFLSRWAFKTAAVADYAPAAVDAPRMPRERLLDFGASKGAEMPAGVSVILARSELGETLIPGRVRVSDSYIFHQEFRFNGLAITVARIVLRVGCLVMVVFVQGGDMYPVFNPMKGGLDLATKAIVRPIHPYGGKAVTFLDTPSLSFIGGIRALAGWGLVR